MFINQLIEKIREKKSNVVVGLDPRLESIPHMVRRKYLDTYGNTLEAAGRAILEFNQVIIDHVADIVPAVKPQIAFYEQYGLEGLKAYLETCSYANGKGLLVIGDVKRGDIGTTSKAYSNAHLGKVAMNDAEYETFRVDAITTNPYLGDDCLKEFMEDIQRYQRGMFVLVKTSNPSSGQLQDLESNGKKIYEIVAEMVSNWSEQVVGAYGYSSVGAVVAATYPEQAKNLRTIMPKSFFLVPGYGAQGGKAEDIIDCFDEQGLGAIINSSRDILYAYKKYGEAFGEENYGQAYRKAAITMRDEINQLLEEKNKRYW